MKVETHRKSHLLLVSRINFVLSTVIGLLLILISTLLYGYSMHEAQPGIEFYSGFGITLGCLIFSYRASAFKPWLVPFGLHVPQEKIIINKYIQICNSTFLFGLVSYFFFIFINFTEGRHHIYDVYTLFFVSLKSMGTLIVFITFIVVPTKIKLSNLLSDKNIFDAEQRDIIRRLQKLGKLEKGSVSPNKGAKIIGCINKLKRWIYNSRTPVFRITAIILPLLILSYLVVGIFLFQYLNNNGNRANVGLFIPKGSIFNGNFANGEFYFLCNDIKINLKINNGIVQSWSRGADVFSVTDENLEKLESKHHSIEGEWFSTDAGDPNAEYLQERYVADSFWIQIVENIETGEHLLVEGGSYTYKDTQDFPYEFTTEFHSDKDMLIDLRNFYNGTDNQLYQLNEWDGVEDLRNVYGGNFGRERIVHYKPITKNYNLRLSKINFNLDDHNKVASIELNLRLSINDYIENGEIEEFKQNELITLNPLIYKHFLAYPDASFDNYGHSSLIDKLNSYFNEKRSEDDKYGWMYPINPVIDIIPQNLVITKIENNYGNLSNDHQIGTIK